MLVPKTGRVFQISLSPYHSPKGELIGSVAILRDVSEQKENEFRLIMTERLAALGQMAAGIGHELNNPLATVSLSAEALLQRLNKGNFDPALFENYLKIIKEEMTRCESAIKSMLSYVKGKGNENGLVDIPTVLDRTVEMVSFLGRMRGVEVLRSYQEGMPLVPGNESELRQVLLTLIGNALDAMEERGKLTLETGIDGDKALIKISDTGPGIPPDLFGKIFEPFFTTKSEKGGTGLGLSIAVKIIKKYNGQIEVTSEEGKGASFKIVLPL
jgi:two-component system NtrC family sensor kinase